jgi:preprotein translocase subunit Sss1
MYYPVVIDNNSPKKAKKIDSKIVEINNLLKKANKPLFEEYSI